MEYTRSLKFEQEPNYKTCVAFFENCMKRHNFDPNVLDYTWKQNRLAKDKDQLKKDLMALINKKPKKDEKQNDVSSNREVK